MAEHHHHDHDHSHGHAHGGGHAHAHAPKDFGVAFAIGVALNLGFVIVEASYGLLANSIAIYGRMTRETSTEQTRRDLSAHATAVV